MKKILIKIFLLIILTIFTNIAIDVFYYQKYTPYFWGSDLFKNKHELISKNKTYNVLFIGSSKTRVQIDTHLFDSLIHENAKIKSFNFGINSLLPPESFYVLDNLLKNNDVNNFRYIIFELGHISNPGYGNLHKKRTTYWLDYNYYKFTLQALWESNRSVFLKAYSTMAYSINFVDKLINLDKVDEISKYYTSSSEIEEEEGEDGITTAKIESLEELDKNQGFKKNSDEQFSPEEYQQLSDELNHLKKISSSVFNAYEKDPVTVKNLAILNLANHYIKVAEKHNIHLIFAFTRQWNDYQYKDLIPIFQKIDPIHKIIFSDSRKYPELFSADNSNDFSHLNSKGSRLLTNIIATQFKQIIKHTEKSPPSSKETASSVIRQ